MAKKFEEMNKEEIFGMAKALVRHFAFNTNCKETGEKIGFAFSQNKQDPSVWYYNDESYDSKMAKKDGGTTSTGSPQAAVDTPVNPDDILDF